MTASHRDLVLEPENNERLANLAGPLDEHLRQIELRLGVEINNRGNLYRVIGDERNVALAAKLQAPIVHALRGKEHIEWQNPYDVGMTGLLGFASGYRAMEKCDALLMPEREVPGTRARAWAMPMIRASRQKSVPTSRSLRPIRSAK